MVRPCKRRKIRNPAGKVSRRGQRNISKKTVVFDPTVSRFWDPKKTIQQNFAAVGLASRVNGDLCVKSTQAKLAEWQSERLESLVKKGEEWVGKDAEEIALKRPMLDEREIFDRLEELFHEGSDGDALEDDLGESDIKEIVLKELEERSKLTAAKEPERLSEFEQQYISKLVAKHGNNFKAMFMDHRLNSRQLTARELEKMASKL